MSPRSLRPSMPAGSLTSQNYWLRQEWKADGRSLGQPLCIGPIWVRLLSWILAIPQFQHWPWTISATCLKSERPNTPVGCFYFLPELADVRSWPLADIGQNAFNVAFGGKADIGRTT